MSFDVFEVDYGPGIGASLASDWGQSAGFSLAADSAASSSFDWADPGAWMSAYDAWSKLQYDARMRDLDYQKKQLQVIQVPNYVNTGGVQSGASSTGPAKSGISALVSNPVFLLAAGIGAILLLRK